MTVLLSAGLVHRPTAVFPHSPAKKASEGGTMPSSEAFLSALAQRDPLAYHQGPGLRFMKADWPQPSAVPGAVSLEVF